MLREISWRQYLEWQAFAELEPFDERRADYRAAQITTMVANVNRDPKKRPKPFSLEDFVLKFDTPIAASERKQSLDLQKSILMAIGHAASAKAIDG